MNPTILPIPGGNNTVHHRILKKSLSSDIENAAQDTLGSIYWANQQEVINNTKNRSELSKVYPEDHKYKMKQNYTIQTAIANVPGFIPGLSGIEMPLNVQNVPKREEEKSQGKKVDGCALILLGIQIVILLCFFFFVSYDEALAGKMPVRKRTNYDSNSQNVLENNLSQFYPKCIILVLFAEFVSYGPEADSSINTLNSSDPRNSLDSRFGGFKQKANSIGHYGPLFQDVHVMIFIGFGFLMTFLRKYSFSAVGYNLLIAAIAIQWSILCRGLFHREADTIAINIESLINGDFAAAAVLISFGAVLGITSPIQLITMCIIEVFLYALNEFIGAEILKAIDVGGSIFIHTFGAYFGLALSMVLKRQKDLNCEKEGSSYNSDVFAMIGTVFLWLFWPSFNGALAVGNEQHRAVLNTVLSLTASCIFTFAFSSLLNKDNKFSMVHIQNASLAGGVAVGSAADLMIRPFGALLIGGMAGVLSTVGYVYVTPFLQKRIGLHDTCGVHNLHGMPGIFAGFISVFMAGIASEKDYGLGLYLQYPARAPFENSSELSDIRNNEMVGISPGLNRTAGEQSLYQLAALGATMGIAILGGVLTGLILKIPIFSNVPKEGHFDDTRHWEVEEGEEEHTRPSEIEDVNTINGVNTFEISPTKADY